MGQSGKRNTPPYGWGAKEILRSLREDARRYRRPGRPSSQGDATGCDEAADTIREHRRPE